MQVLPQDLQLKIINKTKYTFDNLKFEYAFFHIVAREPNYEILKV